MPSLQQTSFVGGEIAPELHARTDIDRYRMSLKTCRNFLVTDRGAARNRTGTELVRETASSTEVSRLIPFVFNVDQAYAIEFGEYYIRFHTAGGTVLKSSGTHQGVDHVTTLTDGAAPSGTLVGFTSGELVGLLIRNLTDGSSGIIVANTPYTASAVLTGGIKNQWTIGDAYEILYEIESPYAAADLARLHFAQSNDVLTIAHPNYMPNELRRLGHTNWEIIPILLDPPVNPPIDVVVASGFTWGAADATHPVVEWEWVVVAIDAKGNRSLPSEPLTVQTAVLYGDRPRPELNWTPATSGNPAVLFEVYRGKRGDWGFVGQTDEPVFIDEGYVPDIYTTPPKATNPFERTIDGDDVSPWRSLVPVAGVATKVSATAAYNDKYVYAIKFDFTVGDDVTWELQERPAGGGGWNTLLTKRSVAFYSDFEALLHYTEEVPGAGANHEFRVNVTVASGTPTVTLQFVSYKEDTGSTVAVEPNFPSAVCFFEQRQVFGRFASDVGLLVLSQTGDYNGFQRHSPARDDDALFLSLAGSRLEEIRNIVPGPRGLYIFTAAGEAVLRGQDGGALTPLNRDVKTITHYGSSWVSPVLVGNAILLLSDRDRGVREIGQDSEATSLVRDLSLFSGHLFEKNSVVGWDYADVPNSIVWAVRDDGVLLGLTYVRDQGIIAWHRHDTDGEFESVCCIPEGNETRVYVIVKRIINGVTKRYVEVLASRDFREIEDAVFLDSAVSYDGRNTSAIQLQLTGGGWSAGEALTLTADAGVFTAGDVGTRFLLELSDGTSALVDVTGYTDTQNVKARCVLDIPTSLQGVNTATWTRQVNGVSGLSHLEAKDVGALLDGSVYDGTVTVAAGAVSFGSNWAGRIHVGLPYVSELETLRFDAGDAGNTRHANKVIRAVSIEVDNTVGLRVGTGPDDLALVEADSRAVSDDYDPIQPKATLAHIRPLGGWDREVYVRIEQPYPLPVTVLGITPEVEIGGT